MREVKLLAGTKQIEKSVLEPFSEEACDFLAELSSELRNHPKAKQYPDVWTFAFWCRKANLSKLKNFFMDNHTMRRIGRGIVFHIAPSNVPVNMGFTYAFGLLAGNANVVRVSTKAFGQIDVICEAMEKVFLQERFERIRRMTSIVSYPHDKEITAHYSALCNSRVIWGGDRTIEEIRETELPSRSNEITFADRYSFGILNAKEVGRLEEDALRELADKFYNDTYLMDQNACSSPHLLFWLHAETSVKKKFWDAVYQAAQKYELADSKVSEKYTLLCESAIDHDHILQIHRYSNLLYVIKLENMSYVDSDYRGKYGMFYEMDIKSLEQICPLINEKVQTCLYFGVNPEQIGQLIQEYSLCGMDRIVPFGQSLDIGLYWDGYDIIRSLSRCVEVI